MEKILTLSFTVILILVSFSFANAQYLADNGQNDAIAVIKLFFEAQTKGDVKTIRECLGGDLLKKRLSLLNNPDYSKSLYDMFKDAHFEILDSKTIGEDRIQVDVKIYINEYESQHMRYFLKKSATPNSAPRFLIYYQEEIATK